MSDHSQIHSDGEQFEPRQTIAEQIIDRLHENIDPENVEQNLRIVEPIVHKVLAAGPVLVAAYFPIEYAIAAASFAGVATYGFDFLQEVFVTGNAAIRDRDEGNMTPPIADAYDIELAQTPIMQSIIVTYPALITIMLADAYIPAISPHIIALVGGLLALGISGMAGKAESNAVENVARAIRESVAKEKYLSIGEKAVLAALGALQKAKRGAQNRTDYLQRK